MPLVACLSAAAAFEEKLAEPQVRLGRALPVVGQPVGVDGAQIGVAGPHRLTQRLVCLAQVVKRLTFPLPVPDLDGDLQGLLVAADRLRGLSGSAVSLAQVVQGDTLAM